MQSIKHSVFEGHVSSNLKIMLDTILITQKNVVNCSIGWMMLNFMANFINNFNRKIINLVKIKIKAFLQVLFW